jgi:hypothetical protein
VREKACVCVRNCTQPLYVTEHEVARHVCCSTPRKIPGPLETTVKVLIKDFEIDLALSVGGIEKKSYN